MKCEEITMLSILVRTICRDKEVTTLSMVIKMRCQEITMRSMII